LPSRGRNFYESGSGRDVLHQSEMRRIAEPTHGRCSKSNARDRERLNSERDSKINASAAATWHAAARSAVRLRNLWCPC
jgi:hypothetical protein